MDETKLLKYSTFNEEKMTFEKLFSIEVLAEAHDILYGQNSRPKWNECLKAAEMQKVIIENKAPCVDFTKWVKCIAFLYDNTES